MRIFFIAVLLSTFIFEMCAQVPYFAETPGAKHLYGYVALKIRPGNNAQETYTTFQYGVGRYMAVGTDISTSTTSAYMGFLYRAGARISKWFQVGGQITPSFNLLDQFKFSHVTTALYMNGVLTNDSKLFWVTNTWLTYYGITKNCTIDQWVYLGYTFQISKERSITPMLGSVFSWMFYSVPTPSIGLYYTHNSYNFYLWSDNLIDGNPRIVLGADFKF